MVRAHAGDGIPEVAAMIHCPVNVAQAHLPDHAVGPPLVTPDFDAWHQTAPL